MYINNTKLTWYYRPLTKDKQGATFKHKKPKEIAAPSTVATSGYRCARESISHTTTHYHSYCTTELPSVNCSLLMLPT